MEVTALAGGVGGAKLMVGLQEEAGSALTSVVNTGDDTVIYGVHVSPDVDIVTYWLAGVADTERGWGIEGDTFTVVESMRSRGQDAWFSLGDRDLATCMHRTEAMRSGQPLSVITQAIAATFGVSATVLPMTDDEVATKIVTSDGRTLDFQEYFVKERCAPEVREVLFRGIDDARPAPGVLDSITTADRVVLCPSNPLLSIGPILAVAGIREALRAHPHVTAVSPIVGGAALKGPADRILRSTGHRSSAAAVAELYADFVDVFVIDEQDAEEATKIEALGMSCIVTDTVMVDRSRSTALARTILR